MSKIATFKLSAAAAAVLAVSSFTAPVAVSQAQAAELTGNIGVFSKYVLRGNTFATENAGAALQGGFDYEHESGFYAGYWGSSLDYAGDDDVSNAVENDFYAGYAGEIAGFTYGIGLIYYYYLGDDDSNNAEAALSLGYGPVSLNANIALDDSTWANAGDTYLTLNYETELPREFTFGATAGYYLYDDSEGDYIAAADTTQDNAFRHLDLTLSRPIGETGADMSLTYILGGELRDGQDLGDTIVFGLTYAFDI